MLDEAIVVAKYYTKIRDTKMGEVYPYVIRKCGIIHNKVFGGYLMRKAYEIAWTNANLVIGDPNIYLIELDNTFFRYPVEVDRFLSFRQGPFIPRATRSPYLCTRMSLIRKQKRRNGPTLSNFALAAGKRVIAALVLIQIQDRNSEIIPELTKRDGIFDSQA